MAEELAGEELLAVAAEACAAAVAAGAQWADAALTRSREIAVEIEKSAVASAETASSTELSVRAVTEGARGMFLLDGVTREGALAAGRAAAELSRQGTPDPDFVALPGPAPVEPVTGLYDPAVAGLTVDEAAGIAVSNIEAARAVAPEAILSGGVETHTAETAFVNSVGVTRVGRSTRVSAQMSVVVRRGKEVGSFYDFDVGRRLQDVALASLSAEAARWALRFVGARRVPSKRMALVLGPLASFGFLRSLAANCNAESIQRKRSFLVGRQGRRIGSSHLTLTDDGLIPGGMGSRSYDGEGAARRRVTLIRQGIFQAVLHNSYTAHKAHEPNTGHGSQGGGVSPTNTQVELGSRTADEIIADTEEGIYINAGGLSANPVSGDISASVDFGFKIERGELAYPVTNTMVAGNVLDFLANIDAVSRDCRWEPGNCLPTLRIQDVQVAGSG
jgi:PmbA protein